MVDLAKPLSGGGGALSSGAYERLERIAVGGMAELWLARRIGPANSRRLVALKQILPHLAQDPTLVEMFLDEAKTSAVLQHKSIVEVFDLGRDDATYYLAMEYIEGECLASVRLRSVRRRLPMTYGLIARMVSDVAHALDYAHTRVGSDGAPLGIVHRDVSPQNLLIAYDGMVKVVDFGIAKARHHVTKTLPGTIKGKHGYMSPEQCLGEKIDGRSDVFSLGIILYELCTGTLLFKGASELRTLEMIARAEVRPPSVLNPSIPPELERITMRALTHAAADRYPAAANMAGDLDRFLARSEHHATHAQLAAYMRSLFGPDIAEKQARVQRWLSEESPVESRRASPAASRQGTADTRPESPNSPEHTPKEPRRAELVYASSRSDGSGRPRRAVTPVPRSRSVLSALFRATPTPKRGRIVAPLGMAALAAEVPPTRITTDPYAARSRMFLTSVFGSDGPGHPGAALRWFGAVGLLLAVAVFTVRVTDWPGSTGAAATEPGGLIPVAAQAAATTPASMHIPSVPAGATTDLGRQPPLLPGDSGSLAGTAVRPLGGSKDPRLHRALGVSPAGAEPLDPRVAPDRLELESSRAPRLRPLTPNVRVTVDAGAAASSRAAIFFDGVRVGRGKRYSGRVEAGEVTVEARIARGSCAPGPRRIKVEPGVVHEIGFTCEVARARAPRGVSPRDARGSASRPLHKPRQ